MWEDVHGHFTVESCGPVMAYMTERCSEKESGKTWSLLRLLGALSFLIKQRDSEFLRNQYGVSVHECVWNLLFMT